MAKKATKTKAKATTTRTRVKAKTTAAKPAKAAVDGAYKTHRPGSNAGKLHAKFDETYALKGSGPTQKLAEKLGIKAPTLRVWVAAWRRELNGEAPPAKRAAKTAAPDKTSTRTRVKAEDTKPAKTKSAAPVKRERLATRPVKDAAKGKASARKAA